MNFATDRVDIKNRWLAYPFAADRGERFGVFRNDLVEGPPLRAASIVESTSLTSIGFVR